MPYFDHHRSEFGDADFNHAAKAVRDAHQLCALVDRFEPRIDSRDQLWTFHLKVEQAWLRLDVTLYEDRWYFHVKQPGRGDEFAAERLCGSFSVGEGAADITEVHPELARKLPGINVELTRVLEKVTRDPLGYHAQLMKTLPYELRSGVIPRSFAAELMPGWSAFAGQLTPLEEEKILALCEGPDGGAVPGMTAALYFRCCQTAYRANGRMFEEHRGFDWHASGRDLYRTHADGRDAGLAAIDPRSKAAFERWYAEHHADGGHPWEIYPGGNSSHINLAVTKDESAGGWRLILDSFSSSRLVETCRIALALQEAGVPFTLAHKESIAQRLRGADLVGIIPEWESLKYGRSGFPAEFRVADTVHFSWLTDNSQAGRPPRSAREIAAAAAWLPIPPLRPRRD